MIPIRLRISGFLSYRDPVELDFTRFDLACISGPNGAGKSSLLDAITWVLFGQARRRDDAIVNLGSTAAEVVLTFQYEGAIYRVQRSLPRGKTSVLEFQVLQPEAAAGEDSPIQGSSSIPEGTWRVLTERTLRDTQSRIEHILHLDYDTFINASFFLQGKADQFAQQTPARRKEVLGSILAMEIWETYRARAVARRQGLETELATTDGRLGEIDAELADEAPRRQRLAQLESDLSSLSAARTTQAAALENLRRNLVVVEQQRLLVDQLERVAAADRARLIQMEDRLSERQQLLEAQADLTHRAEQIEAAYGAWRQSVAALEDWEKVAANFRDHERERAPLVQAIATEQARLEEETRQLQARASELKERSALLPQLGTELDKARARFGEADADFARYMELQQELSRAREAGSAARAQNEALKQEMDQLKSRIDTLESATGAACPLCGQPLSEEHRVATLESLRADGKSRGDTYRLNRSRVDDSEKTVARAESELRLLAGAEKERTAASQEVAQLSERLATLTALTNDWDSTGRQRLSELERLLKEQDFAMEARRKLAKVDQDLAAIGYDAAAHDRARLAEQQQRAADEEYRKLETARAALAPLENEIAGIQSEIASTRAQFTEREAEAEKARQAFEAAQGGLPDLAQVERDLFEIQERENVLNQQVGAARQKVNVLEDLRQRKVELESARQSTAVTIGRYRHLERAFGQNGVPALLIEQALPEIEGRANELLDRLSDGRMSVHFITQADFKDHKRKDLRETLDIQVSDGAGPRDYELYSGGEAFRVNFAIRLALSQVLAGRKGARLQTLVIDEGFASQDAEGRQRLIEAINIVKDDFAKVLLITHLEELKDAFPTRIEVEKTDRGSVVHVL
jgi:exonuclease SbcC